MCGQMARLENGCAGNSSSRPGTKRGELMQQGLFVYFRQEEVRKKLKKI